MAQAAEYFGVSKRFVEGILPDLGAFDMAKPGAGKRLIRIPKAGIDAYIKRTSILPDVRQVRRSGWEPLKRRTDK